MQRILRGAPAAISITFYDGETPTDSDDAVTIQVVRGDGTDVVAAGTATSAGDSDSGTYTYVLDGATHTDRVDVLTAYWTATISGGATTLTTQVEVVGGFYVSLAEIRALKNLDDTNKFTTDELIAARQWFEEKFERATGVAWVPRYARLTLNGSGTSDLLPNVAQIRAVRGVRTYTSPTAYTDYTEDELADIGVYGAGLLRRLYLGTFTYGNRNYVIDVEHGYDEPPSDVREAALIAIRDKLIGDQTGSRVYAVQTEDGIVRNSTAGAKTPFGIPFVDEVVAARSHAVPVIA